MLNEQFTELKNHLSKKSPRSEVSLTPMTNGGALITATNISLPHGWNRQIATVLFVAPPGYPGAAPDCFWVEPDGLRLVDGGVPQSTNDSNPIPGDVLPGRQATWFSWHVQGWNPNKNTLVGYFQLILERLNPAR